MYILIILAVSFFWRAYFSFKILKVTIDKLIKVYIASSIRKIMGRSHRKMNYPELFITSS